MTARVAVCIPAYDEVDGLAATLASIASCDTEGVALQVIVAVDGADPSVVEVARRAGVTVVPLIEHGGSYVARNAAIDHIAHPVDAVLFTDAECTVGPDWVKAHLRALDAADQSGGAVHFTFTNRPSPAEWVDSIRHLVQERYVSVDGFAVTCNLAVRWSVLDQQRFDPSFTTGGDADFGRRARARGLTITYSPDAWVGHPARRTPKALRTKVQRIVDGMEGQRARWEERGAPPRAVLNRGTYRRAREAGLDVGWVWGVRACLLNYRLTKMINDAVDRLLASPAPADPP